MSRRVSCCNSNLAIRISCHYSSILLCSFIFSIIFVAALENATLQETGPLKNVNAPNDKVETAADEQFSAESLNALFGVLFTANFSSAAEEHKKSKPISSELLCNAQENSMCENARMCRRKENASDFECICRKGHAGKFCQFSLFARNCADAFAFHEEEIGHFLDGQNGGVWQLDVDGSAPLPPTFAECKMINDGEVATVVANNVPAGGAVVRTVDGTGPADAQNVFFPISYKLFSASQLGVLIARSFICRQNIRFACEQSPLAFKENRTWLEVVSRDGKQHRQIGTHQQFSCACRNKELYGCGRDNPALACYCDDLSQPSAVDQATLYNASAGVSAVYFRASNIADLPQQQQQQFGGAQNFTLGPLECSGEAGTSLHGTAVVTLRSPSAGLGTGTLGGPWRQLEFDFRTGQPDIDQMVAGWDPDDNGLQMKISLRAGYRIELTLSHQASMEEAEKSAEINQNAAVQQQKREIRREMSISIASQRPLNDLFWHRVLVEVFRGEIRFSVDRLNAFQPLSFPFATSTKFTIGGDEKGNGFVGCLGNFQIDQKLLNWHEQLAQKEKDEDFQVVASGCLELCAEHKCEQDSKCVEHFDTESTSCACKLPRIHYGEHCEKNINTNSSATFRGGTWGFLRFFDLPVSALHSDVIFSVRTDQRRALFLYEHDHADNFVQIHLADEYQIVLTLNNLSKIVSCSLFAPPAKTFNDMRWLQVVLERNAAGPGTTTTILHVDDDHCEIGPTLLNDQLLSDQQIDTAAATAVISDLNGRHEEAAPNDDGDAILPPAPPVPPEKMRFFHMLYVGGMPRVKRQRRERRERLPVYLSNVPQLRGCIRGLLVDGEKVDMREAITNRTLAHKNWDSVQIGCEHVQCDQLHCENGGQCSVNWNSANSAKTVQCDCARSSFTGENCTEDIGLSFIGNSSVVFDMAEPKRFAFFQQSDRQTLSFAYAVKNGTNKQRHAQQLATIYFEDGREFHVVLDRNGTLFVGVFGPKGPINVQHITGIFNDGLRHHFHVHFLSYNVRVELLELYGTRRSWLIACEGMNLANAQRFYFGGRKNVVEKHGETASTPHDQSGSESVSEEQQRLAAADGKEADHADANSMPADGIMPGPEHNPDSNLLADAMRQILARSVRQPQQQLDLRENGIQTEHLLDKVVTNHLERTIWWPQQIDHFIGSISSALIVFERDVHKLTFTPFLYYFQKSELLHRNVFNEPPSAEEPLAPTGCGQFKVPEKAKKAQRNVSFPVWEAPFGPIPFQDEVNSAKLVKNNGPLTAEKNGEDHEFARWLLILLLLIILSAFCLFLIAFLCRQTVRQLIGRTYVLQKPSAKLLSEQKRPMLKVETNGPVKRRFTSRSDSLEPIQLAQHKRFFPLEGSFCGISPAVTPTAPPEPKPGASILRNFPAKIQSAAAITAPPAHAFERERAQQQDSAATAASSSTVYFTAQEEFAENGEISSSSPAISFKSLDDPAISSAGEESTTIGQAFDENAPELFDENTLQLSTALSSSIGGSSHFSSENSIGGRGQKLHENHLKFTEKSDDIG